MIEREILIKMGMVWPISSDKWKAPLSRLATSRPLESSLEASKGSFNEDKRAKRVNENTHQRTNIGLLESLRPKGLKTSILISVLPLENEA